MPVTVSHHNRAFFGCPKHEPQRSKKSTIPEAVATKSASTATRKASTKRARSPASSVETQPSKKHNTQVKSIPATGGTAKQTGKNTETDSRADHRVLFISMLQILGAEVNYYSVTRRIRRLQIIQAISIFMIWNYPSCPGYTFRKAHLRHSTDNCIKLFSLTKPRTTIRHRPSWLRQLTQVPPPSSRVQVSWIQWKSSPSIFLFIPSNTTLYFHCPTTSFLPV